MSSLLPTIYRFHETAWLIQFHTGFDPLGNRRVHQLARQFLASHFSYKQVIPGYDSLYLEFEDLPLQKHGANKLEAFIAQQVHSFWQATDNHPIIDSEENTVVTIPVCYDSSLGNDLEAMAIGLNLTVEEIIELHTGRIYQVFLLGFLPGFPYMGQVDERIACPRKQKPVPVKAGAVGIAGQQTGIYPTHSPGGWNIVGHTPLVLFNPDTALPTLFQPGQLVQFSPIDFTTFKNWPAA